MSDVIAVSTPASRTYPVPTGVVTEVLQGVRWSKAYDTDVPEAYQQAATLLASGAVLDLDTIDDLALLFDQTADADSNGWLPGQDGYPSRDRILSSLAGGSELREWSEGILRSVGEQAERRAQALLSSIGYDPEAYMYRGLCASADPDIVTDLIRSSGDEWQQWDALDSSWRRIEQAWADSRPSVDPDASMLAAIVDAVGSGDRLLLTYATPVTFLPQEMPVTSLPDDVDVSITAAVVDDVDVTAVWSVVRIEPGPVLSIRSSGAWEPLDDWPVSGHVASLVVLDDDDLAEQIIENVDATDFGDSKFKADAPVSMGYYTASELRDLTASMDRTFGEALAQIGAYRRDEDDDDDYEGKAERRRKDRSLVSDIETVRDWAALRVRRDTLTAALNGRPSKDIETVVADLGGKYHPGARRLRRYWTRGKGALKIAWGVHGDWRRCYRRLFKYMGPRAAGYCQLRHKETTGLYTGDKLHRAGVSTVKGAMDEPCPPGHHRMPDGECMADEEMESYAAAAITAAYNGSGGMVALVPRETQAQRLAVEGGESVEDLHVTLAFLGEVAGYDDWNRNLLVARVRALAAELHEIEAKTFGFAHWNPNGEDPCWVYSVGDGGDLLMIRENVLDAWRGSDPIRPLLPPQHTPWVPHITAKYAKVEDIDLDDLVSRLGPVVFDRVRVSFGQDVIDIPLPSPGPQESEADQLSSPTTHARSEEDAR